MKNRVFSGIQPSNCSIHLGNYLGALCNFVKLQEQYQSCFFSVVDLHACTIPKNAQYVRYNSIQIAKTYLAAGIHRHNIFLQSSIPEHLELFWMLSSFTKCGWLKRMTQFKSKSSAAGETAGLFTYPVLMAADILLYNADIIPVGEDQMQHIELTKQIALSINHYYKHDIFNLPNPYRNSTPKICALDNPNIKMSKSSSSENGIIFFSDTDDQIAKKIKKAVSGSEFTEEYAGVSNLVNIYSALNSISIEKVFHDFQNISQLKSALTDCVIALINKFRQRMCAISDHEALDALNNNKIIRNTAYSNMETIKSFFIK